ncbi:hypothetical protein IW262DRAFT_1465003 [Armillaria fumosa]|nr:hypothetical protein IW262DRAFT_1465003 [Armillaria fumosa]
MQLLFGITYYEYVHTRPEDKPFCRCLCHTTSHSQGLHLSIYSHVFDTSIHIVDEDHKKEKGGCPACWTSDKPMWFQNPWPSWKQNGQVNMLSMFAQALHDVPALLKVRTAGIPVRTLTWGMEEEHHREIKATWLGHVCFLIELPFVASLGDRCSPTQLFGPKRYTKPPCKIEEIPQVDAIIISAHNLPLN